MEIQWDAIDERYIDRGVDRGVIYGPEDSFAAWNGLISVEDIKDPDSFNKYYYEGVLTNVRARPQEYSGKITAYTYPSLLDKLCGLYDDDDGIIFKRSENTFFDMTYRTGVFTDFSEHYKIHLLYNIMVVDATVSSSTILAGAGDTTEFSWNIAGIPEKIEGFSKPTVHVTLDSRKIDPADMKYVETALYGTMSNKPRMLTTHELRGIRLRTEWNSDR